MWNPESKDVLNYLTWSDFFESTLLMNKEDVTRPILVAISLCFKTLGGLSVSQVIITNYKNP